jgi:hypothetical protein
MLAFIARATPIKPDFGDYAQRGETRREHLRKLQAHLGVRPFGRQDYRIMARIVFSESLGTDRGEPFVADIVISTLLPSAAVLEKIAPLPSFVPKVKLYPISCLPILPLSVEST